MNKSIQNNWLTGINAVAAVLEHHPDRVLELHIESGAHNQRVRSLADQARAQGLAVQSVSAQALDTLAAGRPHQGIAARCRAPKLLTENELQELVEAAGQSALVLVLDQVQDPGNLGACLRSAAAAGVTAVVIPKHGAAPITPVVRKAAAGAAETLPIAEAGNLRQCLEKLKATGLWITGAAAEADKALWAADFTGPVALVLGGEGKGLRRLTRETCDQLVQIPISASVESLNVSVACGVCLFEVARQRQVAA